MNIQYYEQKISSNIVFLTSLTNKIKRMPYFKLLCFMLILFWIIVPFQTEWNKAVCFSLSFISLIIFIFLQNKDAYYLRQADYYTTLNGVYSDEISFLNGDFSPFYNGEKFIEKKHEYSYDLDIFGQNSLYQRINRTVTHEASERLAYKLGYIPDTIKEILCRQQSLKELTEKDDFRFQFIAVCRGFQRGKNNYAALLKEEYQKNFLTTRVALALMWISISLTAIAGVLAYFHFLPWSVFTILVTFQLIFPGIYAKKSNKSAAEAGKLHKNMTRYTQLLNLVDREEFYAEENASIKNVLFSTHNSLEALKSLSSVLEKFDQRNNVYVLILLNGLFLSDLFLLRKYWKWKNRYVHHIEEWINALAEMETRISLANFVFNHPGYTLPEINDVTENLIKATRMGHPFIPQDKLVTNDFIVRRNHFAIITGANMAGKSTFLRTVGVNYIMAVNGMKVCAADFRFSVFKLFSSMRNTDDLSSGISYFNAELIRIEQLINFTKAHEHTLIILDEILKGTNSKDKLTGSVLFLKKMSEMPVTGIIATHDLELAKLEDEDSNRYQNYCFEINLSKTIDYAYKIQRGVSKNMNATFLLKQILYPS